MWWTNNLSNVPCSSIGTTSTNLSVYDPDNIDIIKSHRFNTFTYL